MSTIISAAILIAATILISSIFIFIQKKNARIRNEYLLKVFRDEADKLGPSFSRQDVLKNKILGFDALQQRLLIFEFAPPTNMVCIEMDQVKSCSVVRQHLNVQMDGGKTTKPEKHLTSIEIRFDLKNDPTPVFLSFYNSIDYSVFEIAELELNANDWASMLSSSVEKELKTRA